MSDLHTIPDALATALVSLARRCHARGWALATSGNFSARLAADRFAITASGRDKGTLGPGDLLAVDLDGQPLSRRDGVRPSAEVALHAALYRRRPELGAVVHTHSTAATVLSRAHAATGALVISGYEMQKAITGVSSHKGSLRLPIFPNDQDVPRLAREVEAALAAGAEVPGYLLAGHGLYTWGRDLAEAGRHVEGLEFLMECELHARRHA